MLYIVSLIANISVHSLIFFFWGLIRPGSDVPHIQLLINCLTMAINMGIAPFLAGLISAVFIEIRSFRGFVLLFLGASISPVIRQYIDGVSFHFTTSDYAVYVLLMSLDVLLGYAGASQIEHLRRMLGNLKGNDER